MRNDISKSIDDWLNGIYKKAEQLKGDLLKQWNATVDPIIVQILRDFGTIQQERVREIFNNAVTEFYDSYTPEIYKRQGNTSTYKGGLYNVLDMHPDEYGWVIKSGFDNGPSPGFLYASQENYNYATLYQQYKMHENRSGGNNLFWLVFMNGYHGGADSIDAGKSKIWGQHPHPGVPYYRRGAYVKIHSGAAPMWNGYGKWGRPAEKSKPPAIAIGEELRKLEADSDMYNMLAQMVHTRISEAAKKFQTNDVPAIVHKYF